MRSELHVAECGEPGSDDHAQNDKPGFLADQHSVDREQQKTKGDREIPPGVKTSRDGQREDSGVQYSCYGVAVTRRSGTLFRLFALIVAEDLIGCSVIQRHFVAHGFDSSIAANENHATLLPPRALTGLQSAPLSPKSRCPGSARCHRSAETRIRAARIYNGRTLPA